MAITTGSGFGNVTTSSGSVSTGSQTFTQNSLVIVWAFEVTSGSAGTVNDNAADAAGYTLIATEPCIGGILTAWMRNALIGPVNPSINVTYTGGGSGSAAAILAVQFFGANAPGGVCVKQIAQNGGSSGTPPTITLPNTPKQSSAIVICAAQRSTTAPTSPAAMPGGGLSESALNISIIEDYALNNFAATTITWGANALAAWAAIGFEIMEMGVGSYQAELAYSSGVKNVGAWTYLFNAGTRRKIGENMIITAEQSTAIEVDIYLIDSITGGPFLGLASQIVSQIRNPGAAFSTFTPTTVTSRGNGHFSVVIPSGSTGSLGVNRLRFTTSTAQGQPLAQACDGYALAVFVNTIDTIGTDLTTVLSDLTTVLSDLGTIGTNVGTLLTDMGTVLTDLTSIGGNVSTILTDVGTIGTNVGTILSDVGTLLTDVAALPSASAIASAVMTAWTTFSHDTGVTLLGLMRRIESSLTGVFGTVTGDRTFYMRDGTTPAFTGGVVDPTTNSRSASDPSGSE